LSIRFAVQRVPGRRTVSSRISEQLAVRGSLAAGHPALAEVVRLGVADLCQVRNLVKTGRAVSEICSRTNTQTDTLTTLLRSTTCARWEITKRIARVQHHTPICRVPCQSVMMTAALCSTNQSINKPTNQSSSFKRTRQRCIAGSAPGTPFTMDSSSRGARSRLGHDATNTTQQGR